MTQANLAALPLYQHDPLNRFSVRSVDYSNYRPTYPSTAIETILDGLLNSSNVVAADIGAGTGIASRLLGDRGVTVYAIEPNRDMREQADPHSRVSFCSGTAEETGLAESSVDLIICCQAFHWFQPETTLAEFRRILKPDGRVAIMWNEFDTTDALTNQYFEAIYRASNPGVLEKRLQKYPTSLANNPNFKNFRVLNFRHIHRTNLPGLIGLSNSLSYVSKEEAVNRQLMNDLGSFYREWQQQSSIQSSMDDVPQLPIVYRTDLYMADVDT